MLEVTPPSSGHGDAPKLQRRRAGTRMLEATPPSSGTANLDSTPIVELERGTLTVQRSSSGRGEPRRYSTRRAGTGSLNGTALEKLFTPNDPCCLVLREPQVISVAPAQTAIRRKAFARRPMILGAHSQPHPAAGQSRTERRNDVEHSHRYTRATVSQARPELWSDVKCSCPDSRFTRSQPTRVLTLEHNHVAAKPSPATRDARGGVRDPRRIGFAVPRGPQFWRVRIEESTPCRSPGRSAVRAKSTQGALVLYEPFSPKADRSSETIHPERPRFCDASITSKGRSFAGSHSARRVAVPTRHGSRRSAVLRRAIHPEGPQFHGKPFTPRAAVPWQAIRPKGAPSYDKPFIPRDHSFQRAIHPRGPRCYDKPFIRKGHSS